MFRGLELLLGEDDQMVVDALRMDAAADFFGVRVSFDDDEGDLM